LVICTYYMSPLEHLENGTRAVNHSSVSWHLPFIVDG